ncbi:MAG: hypothetical protein ABSC08_14485 [Bryobacteraceae bacterium]
MEPSRNLVILIDALGQSLRLTKGLWMEVLRTAEANGWAPARTAPPPREWNLAAPVTAAPPWDGDFSEPCGQLVAHADAVRVATALRDTPGLPPELDAVAAFCLHGSFMICPLSPELHAYLNGGLQLTRQNRHILDADAPALADVELPERAQ